MNINRKQTLIATFFALAVLALAGGCSGGGGSDSPPPDLTVLPLSDNADLSTLSLSDGHSITPDFAANTFEYTVSVDNSVTVFTITATAEDSNANIAYSANRSAKVSPIGVVTDLPTGDTDITIAVTAEDGTIKRYTLTVTRALLNDNADLSALSLSDSHTLMPIFAADTLGYTVSVNNSVTGFTITATAEDSNANIAYSANRPAKVSPIGVVTDLPTGDTVITIKVTAKDDTNQDYTLTVIRGNESSPDLVILGTPVAFPDTVNIKNTFVLNVVVRNNGAATREFPIVTYYLSTDAIIGTGDTKKGMNTISSALEAGGEAPSRSPSVTPPSVPGIYYYGACVSPVSRESTTTNNCSNSVQVAVTVSPDLTIPNLPTGPQSSVDTGSTFTLNVAVHNTGDTTTEDIDITYYRSENSTIDSRSDIVAGKGTIMDGIVKGDNAPHSIDVIAPSIPRTWYYGACASVTGEFNPANNCSAGVPVTVIGYPDLEISAEPEVLPSPPVPVNSNLKIGVVVRNDGDGETTDAFTITYYRSDDSAISSTDDEIEYMREITGGIKGNTNSSPKYSDVVTSPSTSGTYYYGACVSTVTRESDTANNCSMGVPVTVTAPDLVISAEPMVSPSSTVDTGDTFMLSVVVHNDGNGEITGSHRITYYRSIDDLITRADSSVGYNHISSRIPADDDAPANPVTLTAPATAGTYYYGACISDSLGSESDTANNCSPGVAVTVNGSPDLVISATPTASLSVVTAGGGFTLGIIVRNNGDGGTSESPTLTYYLSTDSTIDGSSVDTNVGTDTITNGIEAKTDASEEDITLMAPTTPATHYYGACVGAVSDESDTANNCSTAVAVKVSTSLAPDLVIATPTVSPSEVVPGGSFTLSVIVRNSGNVATSESRTITYYRSADSVIDSSDPPVGAADTVTGALEANTNATAESPSVTAPTMPGTYYYGACVSPVPDEANTDNNCSDGVQVTVAAPDLEIPVMPEVYPPTVYTDGDFTLSVIVRNSGNGVTSESPVLTYYRSTNSTIDSSDTDIGTDTVTGRLAAGGASVQYIEQTASATAGTYYYGACVATVTHEFDTTNNCSDGLKVPVNGRPDLAISAIPTVSLSTVNTDATFTLGNIIVSNVGEDTTDDLTVTYYRSTNPTITQLDAVENTDAITGGINADGIHSILSTSVAAPDKAGDYYYGACVSFPTGETVFGNNCSASMKVEVNALSTAPDLVITAAPTVSLRANLDGKLIVSTGGTFDLGRVVVGNLGSGTTEMLTVTYYQSSRGPIITPADTSVETTTISGGVAGRGTKRTARSIMVTAPSSSGYYYYGVCVSPVANEIAASNNCSVGIEVAVESPAPDLEVGIVGNSEADSNLQHFGHAYVQHSEPTDVSGITVEIYRSNDAILETASDSIHRTYSNRTVNENAYAPFPLDFIRIRSTTYIFACASKAGREFCSEGHKVDPYNPSSTAPDLKILNAPGRSPSSGSIATDTKLTLSVNVRNDGGAVGSDEIITITYYQSDDSTITIFDDMVGIDTITDGLGAGVTSAVESISLYPIGVGTHYYGACVSVAGEPHINNNCSAGVSVEVDLSLLVIQDQPVPAAEAGGCRVRGTITNQRNGLIEGIRAIWYLSQTDRVSAQYDNDASEVFTLDDGKSVTTSGAVTPDATIYLFLCADVPGHSDYDFCSDSRQISPSGCSS